MRARSLLSLTTALLLLCGAPSLAQNDGSDTAPEHKGNTGWTGGAQDHPSQTDERSGEAGNDAQGRGQSQRDAESAAGQPSTATGVDLNGSPRRFPADKTPE